ncbi:MAG: hypothetical protein U0V56_11240 [Actinomycetota bacterium]
MTGLDADRSGEIVVETCTKRFGEVTAVDGVTLSASWAASSSRCWVPAAAARPRRPHDRGFETLDDGRTSSRAGT